MRSTASGTRTRGPALPFMATQGTIEDPAQAPARTGQGRVETLGVPGLAFTHARDRRTGEEDPAAPTGHPQDHRAGLFEREAQGVRQQDQGHHPHGLRLPPREQPHCPGHAQMRWTRHPTTTTHDLIHENSRSLGKYLRNERHGIGAGSGVSRAGCRGARSARRSPRRLR